MSAFDKAWSLLKQNSPYDPYAHRAQGWLNEVLANDSARINPQGPLAQALARERPPQQPLQITNLPPRETLQEQYENNHRRMPPQMVQSQLPTELTQGAHVAPFKIFGQQ